MENNDYLSRAQNRIIRIATVLDHRIGDIYNNESLIMTNGNAKANNSIRLYQTRNYDSGISSIMFQDSDGGFYPLELRLTQAYGELDYAFPPQSVTLTLEDEIDVSRGEMLVHPDNLPCVGRNFEAMLVWMDEEPMDAKKSFFIKQTTNMSRTHIDSIKYKVDVNTMEHLSLENGKLTKETLPMQLNQIARVVITTAKELFFDPFAKNKATGAFILIDPISNNTSAVGMIIDKVDDNEMIAGQELPTLDLPKLGIKPENYDAIEIAVKELNRQGIEIKIIK